MVGIESVVVGQPIRKFDVNRRITSFRQFQVDQQPSGAAIVVDEGSDALKFNMEPGQFCYGVFGALGIARQQLLHTGLDQIGLHRLMLGAHDADRNTAIDAPILLSVRALLSFYYHRRWE